MPNDDEARPTVFGAVENLGYHIRTTDHDNQWIVQSGGLESTIVQYEDYSLGFYCFVELDDVELEFERLNEANHKTRFGKFSLKDGNLRLSGDFIFCEEGDQADQLARIMRLWDAALGDLKSLVLETVQPQPS
ncbi:MAG TPA: YbjN domain-containing protein [Allosphingosinicella sp.]|nr:YbjN domain-containing protein [Allosphingosinicella sp.]